MSDTKYTALILGATGLVGSNVLDLLLKDNKYGRIYTVSRRKIAIEHDKLIQIISEIDDIEKHIKNINITHIFSCVGSTAAKTPNQTDYYKIDLEYPLKVATTLKDTCKVFSLVSSIGANPSSKNFYLKLKGEVEEAIQSVGIETVHIFRPSLLLGDRKEFRLAEKIAQILSPIINLLLFSKHKDYRSIRARDVASAMVNMAAGDKKGIHIYQTSHIKEVA